MKINRTGITRIVFEFRNFVVKIPNPSYSFEHFLKGLIGNIHEHKTWKYNSGELESGNSFLLCPVRWCSWGGWILIMEKADMKSWEEQARMLDGDSSNEYQQWIEAGFGGDDKADNYGFYKNRLVKVDYGNW